MGSSLMNDRSTTARWGWLLAGVLLLLISNGRWIFPPAAWLAPVGWLIFLERSRLWPGLTVAFALFALVQFVIWRGIIPVPGLLYFVIVVIYALVYFIPMAIHRLLAGRIDGFASTLVFPLALVSIEFVFQRWITPYGSWVSPAYTQTDYLPLVQLVSLTGVAGLSFLTAWAGSTLVWILHPQQTARARIGGAGVYAVVLLAVVVFGHVRMSIAVDGEPVRTAGLVASPRLTQQLDVLLAPAYRGETLEPSALAELGTVVERLNDDLFARTRREARAGARIVAWSETAGRVFADDEASLLDRAARLAAGEDVYLYLAYGVWHPDSRPPLENKVVVVDDRGQVVSDYHKARPIVGAESPFIAAGDGVIDRLDTPFGSIGAVICHDLDFPALLRQANEKRIGLMVGPSADWLLIASMHANMARLRAIESGFSLLRPTSGGRSIAADSRGRMLAFTDDTRDGMVAYLTPGPVVTVYGAVGDLFAWLCVAGFASIAVAALRTTPTNT